MTRRSNSDHEVLDRTGKARDMEIAHFITRQDHGQGAEHVSNSMYESSELLSHELAQGLLAHWSRW